MDTQWFETASQFLQLLAQLASSKPAELQLSVDMNCDLDGPQCDDNDCAIEFNGATKQVSSHVQDICDRVVLMAYFEDGEAMLEHSGGEVTYAQQHVSESAELVVGANLKPSDSDSETFWPDVDAMELAFDVVWQAYGALDKFTGFAVHHYGYWRTLEPDALADSAQNRREVYWWCGSSSGGADAELCNIYEQEARDELLSFAGAHAVHVVYIDAPAIVALATSSQACSADLAVLASFIERLDNAGIDVELIFGQADWALADNHQQAMDTLTNVIAYTQLCGFGDGEEQESSASSDDSDGEEQQQEESNSSSSSTLWNPFRF
jgi:hypothetical protein